MKVALYQMNIIWEDKEANYLKTEKCLEKIHRDEIDLFLMPEMSFTGFSMNTDLTEESNNETVEKMKTYARQYNIALGFGWVKDCGEKDENHYTIISKDGKILSDYTKIHPFSYSGENQKFQGGNAISVFKVDNFLLSTFICYDLRFPEIFQIASKRADVIIVPANWPSVRNEHWTCLLRARAIENQVYIIAVNCVGNMHGQKYSGNSCIIDPNGEVVCELKDKEGILDFKLENDVQKFRDSFQVKNDRRELLYSILRKGY